MADTFLTARQAADLLGIRRETLYAYVSRGLIRSEAGTGRRRRYHREDVERLRRRRAEHRRPEQALKNALDFGGPVLDSAITLIDGGRLYYRGRDALDLARSWTFERAAAWVWGLGSDATRDRTLFANPTESPDPAAPSDPSLGTLEHLQAALPVLAARDPAAWDRRASAVARTGARLLRRLSSLAAGAPWAGSVVDTLLAGWDLRPDPARGIDPGRADDIRRLLTATLVVCLDHELNVSTFTARCVASAGSTPYSVVAAGLAALQGPEHGGHTRRVEALLREIDQPRTARRVMAERLRRGEPIPGFGQPLYPEGDPRCRLLLERLAEGWSYDAELDLARAVAEAGRDLLGEHPTVDFGLVFVARVLRLPADSALTLFALGRAAGWIGHAIEQYERGQLIRPRARYVGEPPAERGTGSEADGG